MFVKSKEQNNLDVPFFLDILHPIILKYNSAHLRPRWVGSFYLIELLAAPAQKP